MNNLLTIIKKYKYIALYFHERPDADALGACFGMYFFIKKHFNDIIVDIPELKNIESSRINNYFKDMFEPIREFDYSNSLAIIFDTPISNRVFSQKFKDAKETYKIDHHIYVETFTTYEFVNTNVSSTCEIVANWIKQTFLSVDKMILNPLLLGILYDTNKFSNPNCYPSTFNIVKWMLENGVEYNEMVNLYLLKSVNDFKKEIKLASHIKFKDNFAYLISKNKKIKSSKINLLSNFSNIKIWLAAYYDYDKKLWFCSIRSRIIPINIIVAKYGGGGHALACGVKLDSIKKVKQLIKELMVLANE